MTTSVVVTGLGVASPNGLGARDFWAATRAGKSGIGPVTRFDAAQYPARLAGEVPASPPRTTCPAGCFPRRTT